jgi:cysteine synthase B
MSMIENIPARGERADRRRDLINRVGRTPLLRVRSLEPRAGVEIYGKAEWSNPGGSVKDRAALAMVLDGEARGLLRPGMTLLDASSGNTGIAYAMIGRELGYGVEIVMPENASSERRRLIEAQGARVILTDSQEGMDGAIAFAEAAVRERKGVFHPHQYDNPENWRAHYHGTGLEILAQTEGRVTHFVAGLGTTGTFTGVSRRLREERPGAERVAVQPDSPLHAFEGLKHLETARVPRIYDPGLATRVETVSTEEAQELAFRLARDEGLRLGPSAAAAAAATVRVARDLEAGVLVTVFCDNADKYLEEPFWNP